VGLLEEKEDAHGAALHLRESNLVIELIAVAVAVELLFEFRLESERQVNDCPLAQRLDQLDGRKFTKLSRISQSRIAT
jgi:hypothetical protein